MDGFPYVVTAVSLSSECDFPHVVTALSKSSEFGSRFVFTAHLISSGWFYVFTALFQKSVDPVFLVLSRDI